MKIKLLFVFTLMASVTTAQTTCDCKANFDTLTTKIRNNYAGYFDRIKTTGNLAHTNTFNLAQKKAITAKTPKECFHALMPYVRYFKDAHLGFTYLTDTDFDFQFEKIDETQFKSYLKKSLPSSIEGIWQNTDANMTLAIIKDVTQKGTFKAVVINSSSDKYKHGLIYCTLNGAHDIYQVTFLMLFQVLFPKRKRKAIRFI